MTKLTQKNQDQNQREKGDIKEQDLRTTTKREPSDSYVLDNNPVQKTNDDELAPLDIRINSLSFTEFIKNNPNNRTIAFIGPTLAINLIGLVPLFGFLVTIGYFALTFYLYGQGQDVGARIMKLRVIRENGDVAGFCHMWTRNLASILSLLALGAGYWTAYSDPKKQTWHDKIMRTLVVADSSKYQDRSISSSELAVHWFRISAILFILMILGTLALYFATPIE